MAGLLFRHRANNQISNDRVVIGPDRIQNAELVNADTLPNQDVVNRNQQNRSAGRPGRIPTEPSSRTAQLVPLQQITKVP